MIKCISRIISILIVLAGISGQMMAQVSHPNSLSKEVLKTIILNNLAKSGIEFDPSELAITHHYYNPQNGVTMTYYQQLYEGVEVYKAIGNLAIKDHLEFVKSGRIITNKAVFEKEELLIGPEASVSAVARHLDMPLRSSKGRLIKRKDKEYEMTSLSYAKGTVFIRQVWAKNKAGKYRLSWVVEIAPSVTSDHWEIVVDALNGSILDQINNTVYCSLERHDDINRQKIMVPGTSRHIELVKDVGILFTDNSQYRIFAPPLESPMTGDRTLETNPADPIASPFGWHDTDGIEGAEHNILRGNNAHAYQDTLDSNVPGDSEPSGMSDLIFDYPFDLNASPVFNLNSDLTNLFFWNNYVHDWSYAFGFNEAAGNFQQNNYGKGGQGEDYIFAETLDGSDTNNANFSGPRDGTNGRMQMYKWVVGNDFEILSPVDISGLYDTGNASFGPTLSDPIIQEIVLVTDNAGDVRDACDEISNMDELQGRIAMIDRGTCDFSFKVHAAQEAGAIACLICNNLDNAELVTMAAGENAELVNIPSLFLSKENCAIMKSRMQQGVVTGKFNETRELSSGFDNGIIVHEYGHGISMRLSGGPGTSGCLTNDEQMGEGTSDFLALVLTHLPDDQASTARGIGTFVSGESRNSRGIRRYPYSTDLSINPQVHSHIRASTRPHDVGEIWADVLWDMYWSLIEEDAYDPTWTNIESGNFKAVQIVIDALKLQECDPSLIDARDALLEADQLNYSGEHQCLLWSVFARRGLGTDTFAGDTDSRYDNINGFKIPGNCGGQLNIYKQMSPTISPGNEIEVILDLENFSEPLSDVIVRDVIPEGTIVSSTSSGDAPSIEGNHINFDVGSLDLGAQRQIKYTLSTENIQPASFDLYDEMEGAVQFDRSTTNEELRGWALTTSQSTSGIFALRVASDTLGGQSFAVRKEIIKVTPGNRLLKFNHKYGTQLGIDGGLLEVSIDQGENWEPIPKDKYLVNPITEQITFDVLYRNTLPAFTGERDWHTTVVDLEDYMDKEILVRFRYVSLRFREPIEGIGWFIDDFELYQRKELKGEACMISGGNILVCDEDFTLVNSDAGGVPVTEIQTDNFYMGISPNPAADFINIELNAVERFTGAMRIISADGKVMSITSRQLNSGENYWQHDISILPPGMYFIELTDKKDRYTIAFIKQ